MINRKNKIGLIISIGNPFQRQVRNDRFRTFSEIFNSFNIKCNLLCVSHDTKAIYLLENVSHVENKNGSIKYKKKIVFHLNSQKKINKYEDFFHKFNFDKYEFIFYLPVFRSFTYNLLKKIDKRKIIIYDFSEIQSININNFKTIIVFLSWLFEVFILMRRSNYVLSISNFNYFVARLFRKKSIKFPLLITKDDLFYKKYFKNKDFIKILLLGTKKEDGLDKVYQLAKELKKYNVKFFFKEKFIKEKNEIILHKNINSLGYINDEDYYSEINKYQIIILARPLSFKNLGNFPRRFIDALKTNIIIIIGNTGLLKNYISEDSGIFSCSVGDKKNIKLALDKAINFYENKNQFNNMNYNRKKIIKKLMFDENDLYINFFSKIFK